MANTKEEENKTFIDSDWRSFYEEIGNIRKEVYGLLSYIYEPKKVLETLPELLRKLRSLIIVLSPYIELEELERCNIMAEKFRSDMNTYFFELDYLKTNTYEFPVEPSMIKNIEDLATLLMKIQERLGLLARIKDGDLEGMNKDNSPIVKWMEK